MVASSVLFSRVLLLRVEMVETISESVSIEASGAISTGISSVG